MDKDKIDLAIRLGAIEHVLCDTLAKFAVVTNGPNALTYVQGLRASAAQHLAARTFPEAEPVVSDHAAAELESHVDRLLRAVEWRLAKAFLGQQP